MTRELHRELAPLEIYRCRSRVRHGICRANTRRLDCDSPETVSDFATCLTGFLDEHDALPLYVSGLGRENGTDTDKRRSVYGIATGTGDRILVQQRIDPPTEAGVWSGPTGALLDVARARGQPSLGFIVDASSQFPDPEAACVLIERAIAPIAGVDIDVGPLRERAEGIRQEKRTFAKEMHRPDNDESSKAEPFRTYQ
ncbi:proteasome assembly chaperone family protein [Halosolutus halophilus]|uniref:proteasome assembly chaperone family protein n=1 Tax=Halosolutus halophilus TaxID=1552990 RepID=UPI0022351351|nr:PAC2 family protein [Halosolutus halophilus]